MVRSLLTKLQSYRSRSLRLKRRRRLRLSCQQPKKRKRRSSVLSISANLRSSVSRTECAFARLVHYLALTRAMMSEWSKKLSTNSLCAQSCWFRCSRSWMSWTRTELTRLQSARWMRSLEPSLTSFATRSRRNLRSSKRYLRFKNRKLRGSLKLTCNTSKTKLAECSAFLIASSKIRTNGPSPPSRSWTNLRRISTSLTLSTMICLSRRTLARWMWFSLVNN